MNKTRLFDGLQPVDLQRVFGISRRSALRWITQGVRPEIVALTRLVTLGDLGGIAPEWRGWILRRGQLHDPESSATIGFTPSELRALPLVHAALAAYRTQRRQEEGGRRLAPPRAAPERAAQEPLRGVWRGQKEAKR